MDDDDFDSDDTVPGDELRPWSTRSFLTGVAVGALAGAAVALLFAPDRGERTRRRLGRGIRHVRDQAESGWDDLRKETRREIRRRRRDLKEATERAGKQGRDQADEVRERM